MAPKSLFEICANLSKKGFVLIRKTLKKTCILKLDYDCHKETDRTRGMTVLNGYEGGKKSEILADGIRMIPEKCGHRIVSIWMRRGICNWKIYL